MVLRRTQCAQGYHDGVPYTAALPLSCVSVSTSSELFAHHSASTALAECHSAAAVVQAGSWLESCYHRWAIMEGLEGWQAIRRAANLRTLVGAMGGSSVATWQVIAAGRRASHSLHGQEVCRKWLMT